MGCGCKSNSTVNAVWKVKMPGPDGAVKSYSSEITARAVNAKVAGSILVPPTSVATSS